MITPSFGVKIQGKYKTQEKTSNEKGEMRICKINAVRNFEKRRMDFYFAHSFNVFSKYLLELTGQKMNFTTQSGQD